MHLISKYFPGLTQRQIEQYAALPELYAEWNQKINVISRKDMEHFYEHHVLHSLAIATTFSFSEGDEIMDLGSGGGFPGIPLAIFFPGVNFHLVDSIQKKMKVAGEVAKAVGLPNVTTQATRAEGIRGRQFDAVVSRAVAPLKDLLLWSRPLLLKRQNEKKGTGGLICLKGGNLHEEIRESGHHPRVYNIGEIFEEEYFREKYIVFVPV